VSVVGVGRAVVGPWWAWVGAVVCRGVPRVKRGRGGARYRRIKKTDRDRQTRMDCRAWRRWTAADTLGTGYVIQWCAFAINGLARVVTAQVTRAFYPGCRWRAWGATGGDARVPNRHMPPRKSAANICSPQSLGSGTAARPPRPLDTRQAIMARPEKPHRTHRGTAQVIPWPCA